MSAFYRVIQGASRMRVKAENLTEARERAAYCGFGAPFLIALWDESCDHGSDPDHCGICFQADGEGK
jgi:hypothetical protein